MEGRITVLGHTDGRGVEPSPLQHLEWRLATVSLVTLLHPSREPRTVCSRTLLTVDDTDSFSVDGGCPPRRPSPILGTAPPCPTLNLGVSSRPPGLRGRSQERCRRVESMTQAGGATRVSILVFTTTIEPPHPPLHSPRGSVLSPPTTVDGVVSAPEEDLPPRRGARVGVSLSRPLRPHLRSLEVIPNLVQNSYCLR